MNALKRWKSGKKYAAKLNLLHKIHTAIAPKIQAMRNLANVGEQQDENLIENNPSVRSGWTWGQVQTSAGKGKLPYFHSIGKIVSDLAIENDPRFAFVQSGMDKASETALHV